MPHVSINFLNFYSKWVNSVQNMRSLIGKNHKKTQSYMIYLLILYLKLVEKIVWKIFLSNVFLRNILLSNVICYQAENNTNLLAVYIIL